MNPLILYFASIALWLSLHFVHDWLQTSQRLNVRYLRLLENLFQLILLVVIGTFDFVVKPVLAGYYEDLEMQSGPRLLIYTLPGGAVFCVTALLVSLDICRRYFSEASVDESVLKSYSFWCGLAFAFIVVPMAAQPLWKSDTFAP